MGKLLFFDIDGTLWDSRSRIPESTVRAIQAARENGHLAFINSGRSRAYIRAPQLFAIEWDGIVSGCGSMIELPGEGETHCFPAPEENRICRETQLSKEEIRSVIALIKRHRFAAILEGRDHLYIDREDFGDDPYIRRIAEDLGDGLLPITGGALPSAIKFSCDLRHAIDPEAGLAALGERFTAIFHTPTVIEFVPRGTSKATGLREVCRLLGCSPEDTVAFGDGANDLPMLREAGIGIVMGGGSPEARACADWVTAPLWEDGIEKALQHLGII